MTKDRSPRPAGDGERLWVADVMVRYGLRTGRAARQVMDEAGALLVGGRLTVLLARLVQWEEAQVARRATRASTSAMPTRRRRARPLEDTDARKAGWWRESA